MVLDKTAQSRGTASPRRSFAKRMRREPTEAEKLFWWEIRDRRLEGYKFKRQHLIGGYIVDFVCLEKKLIIELDGSQHSDAVEYDEKRTAALKSHGFRAMRIWNAEIFTNMEGGDWRCAVRAWRQQFVPLTLILSPAVGEGTLF